MQSWKLRTFAICHQNSNSCHGADRKTRMRDEFFSERTKVALLAGSRKPPMVRAARFVRSKRSPKTITASSGSKKIPGYTPFSVPGAALEFNRSFFDVAGNFGVTEARLVGKHLAASRITSGQAGLCGKRSALIFCPARCADRKRCPSPQAAPDLLGDAGPSRMQLVQCPENQTQHPCYRGSVRSKGKAQAILRGR